VVEVQEFMRSHPDHMDAVLAMASIMQGPNPDVRDYAVNKLQQVSREALLEGFNHKLSARSVHTELTMTTQ